MIAGSGGGGGGTGIDVVGKMSRSEVYRLY